MLYKVENHIQLESAMQVAKSGDIIVYGIDLFIEDIKQSAKRHTRRFMYCPPTSKLYKKHGERSVLILSEDYVNIVNMIESHIELYRKRSAGLGQAKAYREAYEEGIRAGILEHILLTIQQHKGLL